VKRSTRIVTAAIAVLSLILICAVGLVLTNDDRSFSSGSTAPEGDPDNSGGVWLSGASGPEVASGALAALRHREIDIASTWADDNTNMVELFQLQPGAEYGSWTKPLDISIGAIGDGESWEEAAEGAYDDRWRASLTELKKLREGKDQTYIRFAHEMNGNWYPWKVTADNSAQFQQAWKRFRALQTEIFPEAKLVFNVNRESVDTGMDWRDFFPGAEYVDVMGVDYYNQYPFVTTKSQWNDSLDDVDKWGAPKGLAQHLAFAKSVGLPLAISEWSNNADMGDSPVFVDQLLDYVSKNAGTEAGQIEYEILFNVGQDDNRWLLVGDGSKMPESTSAYEKYFSDR